MSNKIVIDYAVTDIGGNVLTSDTFSVSRKPAIAFTRAECLGVAQQVAAKIHDEIQDDQEGLLLPDGLEKIKVAVKIALPERQVFECDFSTFLSKDAFNGLLECHIGEAINAPLCGFLLEPAMA